MTFFVCLRWKFCKVIKLQTIYSLKRLGFGRQNSDRKTIEKLCKYELTQILTSRFIARKLSHLTESYFEKSFESVSMCTKSATTAVAVLLLLIEAYEKQEFVCFKLVGNTWTNTSGLDRVGERWDQNTTKREYSSMWWM